MSLKDIADMAGTSVATASRVLNNPDYRCQDSGLRERIFEAAKKLNYVPNASARQLKTGDSLHSNTFKIDILLSRFNSLEEDVFFEEVFRYLETELLKQGCLLGSLLKAPDIASPSFEKRNIYDKADGVIVLGKCSSGIVDILQRNYKGVMAIDRNPTEYRMDEVVCDGAKAAGIAVEYLCELGHTRIAYIGDCNMESRYMGYHECLIRNKIPLYYEYVLSTGQTKEEGYAAFEKLGALATPPTAVFCANDVTAIGFLEAMKDKNGRKKRGVYRPAVASIDDIEMAVHVSPMLTTVHIPKEDMVHVAVLTLKDRLCGGHREYLRTELPCHLMIRESSGVHVY